MNTQTTNLFATATKVKETIKKTDKKVIKAPLLADKVKTICRPQTNNRLRYGGIKND